MSKNITKLLFPELDNATLSCSVWISPGEARAIDGLPVTLQANRDDHQTTVVFGALYQGIEFTAELPKQGWFCLPFNHYPVLAPRAIEYTQCGSIARLLIDVLYPFTKDETNGGYYERG